MTGDLINTLETPGEFDALTNLRPGEPYFLLVGRDRLAPAIVQKWADENRARALAEFSSGRIGAEKRDRELRKSTQAEAVGWAMQSYKAGHEARRISEARPSERASYSGVDLPEETKRRDLLQSARARTVAALNNAVAEATELADLLPSNRATNSFRRVIGRMARLANETAPQRPVS